MVSPPLIKRHDMFLEGNAAHSVGCDSPLQAVIAVWRTFLYIELSESVVTALC
jgi:hypothetical protein